MKYSDIQIERAKLKFFSDMMLEELSAALYGEGESYLNGVLSAIEKKVIKQRRNF